MLRSIHWYFNFVFSLSKLYIQLPKYNKLKNKLSEEEFDTIIKDVTVNWAFNQLKVAGVTVECEGMENIPQDTNCLFVSNHQGNFDTAVLMAYLDKPKGFIAKKSVEKIFLLTVWMKHMKSLFLDRENPKLAAKVLIDGIKILKSGHSLVIFPEGTRSRSSTIGEFKSGAFKIATKSKVPIVPITLDGSYRIMEDGNNIIKPSTVKLYIHPMVKTDQLTKEEIDGLPNKIFNIINSKLIEYKN